MDGLGHSAVIIRARKADFYARTGAGVGDTYATHFLPIGKRRLGSGRLKPRDQFTISLAPLFPVAAPARLCLGNANAPGESHRVAQGPNLMP